MLKHKSNPIYSEKGESVVFSGSLLIFLWSALCLQANIISTKNTNVRGAVA